MTNFVPVLIPTLNRFDHLKLCVESLCACAYAIDTDLFIAQDYPSKDNHWTGYRKIEQYIKNINGFKSVTIIRRTINFGAVKNLFEAIYEIFDKYDRLILSEDDNIFSYDFLKFVNLGLCTYNNRTDIFSINGYNYPITLPKTYQRDIYAWVGFSAWGCGIWKHKWAKIDFTTNVALKNVHGFLANFDNALNINKLASNYIPGLLNMLKSKEVHGDVYISMYQQINNMYSIFPTVSRVRNMGYDGSGVNCKMLEYDIYKNQMLYSGSDSYELPEDIKPTKEINRILKSHWKSSIKFQAKIAIKIILNNFGLHDITK